MSRSLLTPLSALLSVPLLTLLFIPSALGTVCIVPNGDDWICYTSADAPSNINFGAWCSENDGTIASVGGDRCIVGCCCEEEDGKLIDYLSSEPVSKKFCSDYGGMFQAAVATADCEAICTGAAQPGGSFNLSGYIRNQAGQKIAGFIQLAPGAGSSLISIQSTTSSGYSIPSLPAGQKSFLVSAAGCTPQTFFLNIQQTMTHDFNLTCGGPSCTVEATNDTVVSAVAGEPAVTVSWSPSPCPSTTGTRIYRCTANLGEACSYGGDGVELVGFVAPGENQYVDSAIPSSIFTQRLCYFAVPLDRQNAEVTVPERGGQDHCLGPMSLYCIGQTGTKRCFNNDDSVEAIDYWTDPGNPQTLSPFTGVAHCDEENMLSVDDVCDLGESCSYGANSLPSCGAVDVCDKCNGLFGLFLSSVCNQRCILNNLGFFIDVRQSCGEIQTCSDYHTNASCRADACAVPGTCTWNPLGNLAPFGKGVCLSSLGGGACDQCNEIFAECNEASCASLGNCSYVDNECRPLEEMACIDYETKEACTGNNNGVLVDVHYVAGERVSGTNSIIRRSDDALGIGVCTWTGMRCVKNSDGDLTDDLDDCEAADAADDACFRDNSPPTTTLEFSSGQFVSLQQLRNMKPIVKDNHYLPSEITTFFCLSPTLAPCYPDLRPEELEVAIVGSQQRKLFYYSEDPARNLEPVKSLLITVFNDTDAHLVGVRVTAGANAANASSNVSANGTACQTEEYGVCIALDEGENCQTVFDSLSAHSVASDCPSSKTCCVDEG